MSSVQTHPLEYVLRLIEQAAPEPWRPYLTPGLDRRVLDEVLETLWLEGLIRRATPGGTSPAVELTALGRRVLAEPELLSRLLRGEMVDPGEPASVVRANLTTPPPVRVCKLLIAANAAVFLWGLFLAWKKGLAGAFLWGFSPNAIPIVHSTGSVVGMDLLAGQWWRLMTAGFNHFGLLHVGVNMYSLYAVGAFIEQRYGWWRFLLIYLMAVWTGSCLAMANQPEVSMAGASGGVFGVFAAVIAWLLFYGKHLPLRARRSLWRNVFINVLILTVISISASRVLSHWGHLGGALGGFAVAVVLHFQRFGKPAVRLAAVLAVLLLPAAGWAVLTNAEAKSPRWQRVRKFAAEAAAEAEAASFEKDYLPRISLEGGAAVRETHRVFTDLVDRHPRRRDADAVKQAVAKLNEARPGLQALLKELEAHRPYADKEVEEARQTAISLLQGVLELSTAEVEDLEKGQKQLAGHEDNAQEKIREKGRMHKVEELHKEVVRRWGAWRALLTRN